QREQRISQYFSSAFSVPSPRPLRLISLAIKNKYRNHREKQRENRENKEKANIFLCLLCVFSASSVVNFISD
ncbi:MAG: hypothetical protein M0P50_09780, partial [Bacteroidales bacterium]|nr:hypothetical protein [Bacteroidales bacterium]